MPFGVSVLRAMIALDASEMRVTQQEIPCVIVHGTRRAIGDRLLTRPAIERLLAELLPADIQSALDDIGAVRYEFSPAAGEHFTLVASAGRALRVDIRRDRVDEALQVPPAQALWPSPG